jgi:glycosyltransferase involved in cell wall biosynthesis
VTLVYVVKRFPKFSETFILQELLELERQGEAVAVCSLEAPHPNEPRHEGAEELAARALYLPARPVRVPRLVAASLRELAMSPVRAGKALAWCVRLAVRQRRLAHLRRFGEAAWLRPRVPRNVEHVHAHFAHGPATVALLLGRLLGRPFSFTGHARDIFELVSPEVLAAKAAEARFVVAVSEHTRAHVAAAVAPADRAKVVVIRNGIDARRFAPRARPQSPEPLVLAVSRLVEKKGLETLVDACALLVARGVDVRCEVIGEGPLRARLERRAAEAGLDGRLVLAGGREHAAVRAAFERAAVFALPCRQLPTGDRDGLPVAIVEALAVGVPVVSTPVGGIPEAVRDGESGLLVPPDDPEALADAIARVLADDELRARLVAGGRAAAAGFDLGASVSQLRRLFRAGP